MKAKEILEEKQNNIKDDLSINNIFEEINKEDFKTQLKKYLKDNYEDKITNVLYKNQIGFRDFLIKKGVIV